MIYANVMSCVQVHTRFGLLFRAVGSVRVLCEEPGIIQAGWNEDKGVNDVSEYGCWACVCVGGEACVCMYMWCMLVYMELSISPSLVLSLALHVVKLCLMSWFSKFMDSSSQCYAECCVFHEARLGCSAGLHSSALVLIYCTSLLSITTVCLIEGWGWWVGLSWLLNGRVIAYCCGGRYQLQGSRWPQLLMPLLYCAR